MGNYTAENDVIVSCGLCSSLLFSGFCRINGQADKGKGACYTFIQGAPDDVFQGELSGVLFILLFIGIMLQKEEEKRKKW
ncbi:MAG: hypothetical protein D3906_02655 [Candidatus Electrothrix sp. AUS1_2]|nr:hypothetical protein [Candidatus Electrothrix sp. AUS1_2]